MRPEVVPAATVERAPTVALVVTVALVDHSLVTVVKVALAVQAVSAERAVSVVRQPAMPRQQETVALVATAATAVSVASGVLPLPERTATVVTVVSGVTLVQVVPVEQALQARMRAWVHATVVRAATDRSRVFQAWAEQVDLPERAELVVRPVHSAPRDRMVLVAQVVPAEPDGHRLWSERLAATVVRVATEPRQRQELPDLVEPVVPEVRDTTEPRGH